MCGHFHFSPTWAHFTPHASLPCTGCTVFLGTRHTAGLMPSPVRYSALNPSHTLSAVKQVGGSYSAWLLPAPPARQQPTAHQPLWHLSQSWDREGPERLLRWGEILGFLQVPRPLIIVMRAVGFEPQTPGCCTRAVSAARCPVPSGFEPGTSSSGVRPRAHKSGTSLTVGTSSFTHWSVLYGPLGCVWGWVSVYVGRGERVCGAPGEGGVIVLCVRVECPSCSQLQHYCPRGIHSSACADRLRVQPPPDREV